MKENKLPKSWCVWNDCSQLFKDTVLKYINSLTKYEEFNGYEYFYYGVDKKGVFYGNANYDYFDKVLTLQQFIEMTTEWTPKEGELVEVSNGVVWYKRTFIYKTQYEHIVTARGRTAQNDYRDFDTWNYVRPIKQPEIFELTIEEIAKLKGCKPEQIRIKE